MHGSLLVRVVLLGAVLSPAAERALPGAEKVDRTLGLVVMDPLAAPLTCACVAGYAQRKYERLAEYLERQTGRSVQLVFGESLESALRGHDQLPVDVIIGKDSVVRADAKAAGLKVTARASLTGKDGLTTQTGLFVVPTKDPAHKVNDLAGYRIFFGPPACAEKYAAAVELLKANRIPLPKPMETSAACSDGACRILELGAGVRSAAVISSYAQPLLEGCGTIKKGELRVIGETQPVPFVAAFFTNRLSRKERRQVESALLAVGQDQTLCAALESLIGFIPLAAKPAKEPPAAPQMPAKTTGLQPAVSEGWTGWRGPRRDGLCTTLPRTLAPQPKILWEQKLAGPGLGGVAATEKYVLIGDRDLDNFADVFRCYLAADGTPLWTVQYPAIGKLDYGNTPRATPLIQGQYAYLFGAFGDLHCVRLETGEIVWMKNLRIEFGDTSKLVWGACSSPLWADGKLIVNPGAPAASLAALDPETGDVIWKTPGGLAGFGSLILATFGGVQQIVGHDRMSLGGWDLATGKRLWQLVPPNDGDFNVPTPIQVADRLLVTTENNGTRLYAFDAQGKILPTPVAQNDDLTPDISTPVVVRDRVFCVCRALYCLDLQRDLKAQWIGTDAAFRNYAAVIGNDDRLLVIGAGGELVLVDARSERFDVVSRCRVWDEGQAELYAHPALVGRRLYLRGESALACLAL